MDSTLAPHTAETAQAALACLHAISSRPLADAASPVQAVLDIADHLDAPGQAWVIRDTRRRPSPQASTWPLWFSATARRSERPLLYLTQSPTSAQLHTVALQAAERGIVCNDIESGPSRWPKGAHPWLPLWLLANRSCLPFDPANGAEARAIVLGALQAFYVQGRPGFCYLALHDQPDEVPLAINDPAAAFLGMHCLQRFAEPAWPRRVRLLGAGRALHEVIAAARVLRERWAVDCEIWSCPSYTRLARDAEAAARWRRLHPGATQARSHLEDCLGAGGSAIVAVTGYERCIAEQLGAYISAPFTALGADTGAMDCDSIVGAVLAGF